MKNYVLITAGGQGSRMGKSMPKQFILLDDKPIILHTIQKFRDFDPEIEVIVVIPELFKKEWQKIVLHYGVVNHALVFGGDTRFHSVRNGLGAINGEGIVFIHDAVRPLVSDKTLHNCLKTACEKGNALPVVPVTESLRMVQGIQNRAVARSDFFLVQTPQTFEIKAIKTAYEQEYSDFFTDDASVFENGGNEIFLVDGNRENIKITFPEDLVYANAFLTAKL